MFKWLFRKKDLVVYIKWNDFFKPSYVRKVNAVVKHNCTDDKGGHYGHVADGFYLKKEIFNSIQSYNQGDLFIISEFMDARINKDSILRLCLYYLVRVNSKSTKGFDVIETTEGQLEYPYHENRLVAAI